MNQINGNWPEGVFKSDGKRKLRLGDLPKASAVATSTKEAKAAKSPAQTPHFRRSAERRIPWRARPVDKGPCASCEQEIAPDELITNYVAAQWMPGRIRHFRCNDEPMESPIE